MDEKSRKLFERFPSIFPPEAIREDLTKSCLAWGCEVGPGWFPIVEDMLKKMSSVAIRPQLLQLEQIKEKFGGLRVYYSAAAAIEKQVDSIVAKAEDAAARTCEHCGQPNTKEQHHVGYNNICEACASHKYQW